MMLKSKRTIAGIAVATALMIGYAIYATGSNAPATDDLKGWARLILIFVGVSIGAQIITQIVTHIAFAVSAAAKEDCRDGRTVKRMIESELTEDEMDKRITLRSSHVGYGCAGAGFMLALIALAFFDASAVLMINMMLATFFLSMMAGAAVSLYLYEKGENGRTCQR